MHSCVGDVTLPSGGQTGVLHHCEVEFVYRPTLLLENYQPWLDLKVPSKVDASLSEVIHVWKENTCIYIAVFKLNDQIKS